MYTWEIVEDEKKQKNNNTTQGHIHEEGLGVESLVKLDNLHGLVEHGVNEGVAERISVKLIDKIKF